MQSLENGGEIDTTTGTVKLKALFDNTDEVLFPNQFVNVSVQVDVLHDATLIPTAAIQRGAPGTFVYLVKPDNSVTVQSVTLGPADGEKVAVRSGLAPGSRVVIDGADKLREGARVEVREGEQATASLDPQEPSSGHQDRHSDGSQKEKTSQSADVH